MAETRYDVLVLLGGYALLQWHRRFVIYVSVDEYNPKYRVHTKYQYRITGPDIEGALSALEVLLTDLSSQMLDDHLFYEGFLCDRCWPFLATVTP